jgi:predicted MFS family arabinose efflux permease
MNAPKTLKPALESASTRTRLSPLEPLRHPQYAACWTTGILAHGAAWMQALTVPFLVYEMTESATWLGAAAVAGQAPALIGNPVGGVLADRYSRRGLLLVTLAVKFAVAMALYTLWSNDELTLLTMFVLLVLNGLGSTMHAACWSSFTPQLVPPAAMASAYRVNSIQVNLSRAAGPALAGWVLATYGPGTAFLVAAIFYAPLAAALSLARPRPVPVEPHEGPWRAILAGVRVIREHRGLRVPVLTAAVVSTFGAGLQGLTAGLASDVYGVGAEGFGWLFSSMGISCVLTGVGVALLGDSIVRSTLVKVGLVAYASGAILAGATQSYSVGLVAFGIIGIGHVTVYVSCATALQLHLREEMRGRVTSLYMMGIFLGMPLGSQVGGLLGDLVGLPAVMIAYGIALLVYMGVARVRLRGFADLDGDLVADSPQAA